MDSLRVRLKKSVEKQDTLLETIQTKLAVIEKIENEIEELEITLAIERNTHQFLYEKIIKEEK